MRKYVRTLEGVVGLEVQVTVDLAAHFELLEDWRIKCECAKYRRAKSVIIA